MGIKVFAVPPLATWYEMKTQEADHNERLDMILCIFFFFFQKKMILVKNLLQLKLVGNVKVVAPPEK